MRHDTGTPAMLVRRVLLASISQGAARRCSAASSWTVPIWHWRNHQPRRDQLHVLHEDDITPPEAREIDAPYTQLELDSPKKLQTRERSQVAAVRLG